MIRNFTAPMKYGVAAIAIAITGSTFAQHSDIEFGIAGGKIDIEFGAEGQVFESEFGTVGLTEQFTDDPGFGSEVAEGLGGWTPGTIIDYNILGPLEYHDGTSFAAVPSGVSILIGDNPTGGLTVDASTVGPVSGTGIIGDADGLGDVHTHIDFTLQPGQADVGDNPPAGAYALLMELTTDEAGIANSDPFYIVFNWGLPDGGVAFEGAVEAFASQVPEPTSLAIVGIGSMLVLSRRRRTGDKA